MRILHLARRGTFLHVLLIVVMTMLLAACGNTTPAEHIVGKRKLSKVTFQGETRSGDDLEDEGVLEFFADGTITVSPDGDNTDP